MMWTSGLVQHRTDRGSEIKDLLLPCIFLFQTKIQPLAPCHVPPGGKTSELDQCPKFLEKNMSNKDSSHSSHALNLQGVGCLLWALSCKTGTFSSITVLENTIFNTNYFQAHCSNVQHRRRKIYAITELSPVVANRVPERLHHFNLHYTLACMLF